jgi:hypothetical protein
LFCFGEAVRAIFIDHIVDTSPIKNKNKETVKPCESAIQTTFRCDFFSFDEQSATGSLLYYIFTIIFQLVVRHTTRLVKEIGNILTIQLLSTSPPQHSPSDQKEKNHYLPFFTTLLSNCRIKTNLAFLFRYYPTYRIIIGFLLFLSQKQSRTCQFFSHKRRRTSDTVAVDADHCPCTIEDDRSHTSTDLLRCTSVDLRRRTRGHCRCPSPAQMSPNL